MNYGSVELALVVCLNVCRNFSSILRSFESRNARKSYIAQSSNLSVMLRESNYKFNKNLRTFFESKELHHLKYVELTFSPQKTSK